LSDFGYFSKLKKFEEQIIELQKKYRFDVFSVHHIGLGPVMNKFKTIYTWHGSPPTKNIFRKMISFYFKKKVKNQDIIFISKYMESQFGAKGYVIRNGLSKEFKPSKEDENFMLYVGRLEKHKNLTDLIKLSRIIRFKLKIVGYGPEEQFLKERAKGAPVEFMGRIDRKKLIKLYQRCSFFVSASKWEGFGLIFIEAAACGKPSIAYNLGAIPEVIINKKTGFLVKNFKDFVSKSKILKENLIIRKGMGKKALEFSKVFNWDKTSKYYLDVLKK
jgi:glycosyltransferase involved in cell wall biosynthesis